MAASVPNISVDGIPGLFTVVIITCSPPILCAVPNKKYFFKIRQNRSMFHVIYFFNLET